MCCVRVWCRVCSEKLAFRVSFLVTTLINCTLDGACEQHANMARHFLCVLKFICDVIFCAWLSMPNPANHAFRVKRHCVSSGFQGQMETLTNYFDRLSLIYVHSFSTLLLFAEDCCFDPGGRCHRGSGHVPQPVLWSRCLHR